MYMHCHAAQSECVRQYGGRLLQASHDTREEYRPMPFVFLGSVCYMRHMPEVLAYMSRECLQQQIAIQHI